MKIFNFKLLISLLEREDLNFKIYLLGLRAREDFKFYLLACLSIKILILKFIC
ncbi:MAG: hypothetical protein II870_02045 [Synergistaceae bacterium]|nr:hypothetical protein [Synergistaceae bacterium]